MRFFGRFRKQPSPRAFEDQPGRPIRGDTVIPFESENLPYIKHHGIRVLCGLLMDRNSECSLCPFCGDSEPMTTMLVSIIAQTDAASGSPLVALYFSKTTDVRGSNMEVVRDWATRVGYAGPTPSREAIVELLDNGSYHALYGHFANLTAGDCSSGALYHSQPGIAFRCDPEPDFTRRQCWESLITEGQATLPELACIPLRGEWRMVDRDRERGMVRQVAARSVEDNPNHSIARDGDALMRAFSSREADGRTP